MSTPTAITETSTSPLSNVEIITAPPSTKKKQAKWEPKYDAKLLVAACGLCCHLIEYSKQEAKFEHLMQAMKGQGIDFELKTLQKKLKMLLEHARKEMIADVVQMGFERPASEAHEEACQMVEEVANYEKSQKVCVFFYVFLVDIV